MTRRLALFADAVHQRAVTVPSAQPASRSAAEWGGDPPFTTCISYVLIPSGNPDPDSEADRWVEVECGAPVRWFAGRDWSGRPVAFAGWECDAGHHHHGLERELQLEVLRERAERGVS